MRYRPRWPPEAPAAHVLIPRMEQVSVAGLQQWQAMALETQRSGKPVTDPAQLEKLKGENAELRGVVQALRDETKLLEADLMRQEAELAQRG